MEEPFSPGAVGTWAGLALVLLLIYYIFLGRTLLNMLRGETSPAVLTFALIALIPFPPLILMGIVLMIVWAIHRGEARA